MEKSKGSKSHRQKGSTNLHHPDYKKARLGYTRIPTSIAEDPLKWGLTKNGLIVYLFLLARVKRDMWFNGEALKKWMNIGGEAVANGLKNLVETGFCTSSRNRDANGRIAGWSYQFYAVPRDREVVTAIDAKMAEALGGSGWFDETPKGGRPEPGKPDSGKAPVNRKEVSKPKGNETRKTPDPLREEEGFFDFPSREKGESKKTNVGAKHHPSRRDQGFGMAEVWAHAAAGFRPQTERFPHAAEWDEQSNAVVDSPESPLSSVEYEMPSAAPDVAPRGRSRWRDEMLSLPVGKRLLDILRPEQIPHDRALRSVCNLIRNGHLDMEYLAFLEDNVIRPNQEAADRQGVPLKSIPVILSIMKKEEFGRGEISYQNWRWNAVGQLDQLWQRVNVPMDNWDAFNRDVARFEHDHYSLSLKYNEPQPGEPPVAPPTHFYIAMVLYGKGKGFDPSPTILEELRNPTSWGCLLREATFNHAELWCLQSLVAHFKNLLPVSYQQDLVDLQTNWEPRWSALREEIIRGFARIGSKPPTINPNGEGNPNT